MYTACKQWQRFLKSVLVNSRPLGLGAALYILLLCRPVAAEFAEILSVGPMLKPRSSCMELSPNITRMKQGGYFVVM